MLGLYIHIPFCSHICYYCDFVKSIANDKKKTAYITTLIQELTSLKDTLKDVTTIYIGGGTPSALNLTDLNRLLSTIETLVNRSNLKEYTVEVNPEDVNDAFVKTLNQFAINRVSLGVQSFNDDTLQAMGRAHTSKDALNAIELLKKNGYSNMSLDLIFGYPGQTVEGVLHNIDTAIKLGVPHISPYALILEEKSVLNHLIAKNKQRIIDEDTVSLMYTSIRENCLLNGYEHYEISNFAKAGYESIHNTLYWTDQPYIGVGAGAHSYINQKRYYKTSNVSRYINCPIDQFDTIIYEEEAHPLNDACMMGLRRLEGIHVPSLNKRYNTDIFSRFPKIQTLIDYDILTYTSPFLRLTKKGLLLANEAFMIFMEE